ncbi:TetR/AcrR family transcriptional regulator [Lacrimispora sp. JR3]|uniref:TetR/AcrR family transcriptional regulator n=1 Tax=Lacrimispora sinapis TaxID=3111456 RepID=UPI003748760C
MEDRRSLKTKRAIRNAFLELLKHKNLNRISVVELSKLADLGRGTFYLHYKDVYELMEQLERELIEDLFRLYDESQLCDNSMNVMKLAETITQYMDSNRETFLVLARKENGGRTLEKIKDFFILKILSDSDKMVTELDRGEAVFLVAGVFGILESWMRDGMKTPPKSISKLLHYVLVKFEA